MDLRVELIREYEAGESIAALAEIYQVSRKTIYKWLKRCESSGTAGLADLSRAPHERPQQRERLWAKTPSFEVRTRSKSHFEARLSPTWAQTPCG